MVRQQILRYLCLFFMLCSWCSTLLQPITSRAADLADVTSPIPSYGSDAPHFGAVEAFAAPSVAAQTGLTWERVNVFWNTVEPERPGQALQPSSIPDAALSDELRRGMIVVGLIGNPPEWATRNGSVPSGLDLPLTDPRNQWARFVRDVVSRYAGRIDRWVFWNEPDIQPGTAGSTWAGSDDEFYQLMKVGYLAAKSVNPGATVIFPGTTYWSDYLRGSKQFLERVVALADRDPSATANHGYFDMVDLHIYSRASDVYRIAMIYREILNRYHINVPLMITEMNIMPYDDPVRRMDPGGYRATMNEQAAYMIQSVTYAMAAGVRWISVYKLSDIGFSEEGPYGLVRQDLTPRPALTAYRTAINYLKDASSIQLSQTKDAVVATFTQGKDDVTLAWTTGQAPSSIRVKVTGSAAFTVDKLGNVKPQTVPLTPPIFTLPLPAATMQGDDGGPLNSRVGGDPVLLVQTGLGRGVRVSSSLLVFPAEGHSVAAPFLRYFDAAGGVDVLGKPTEDKHTEQGLETQRFVKRWLRFQPTFKGSQFEIESVPAGGSFSRSGEYQPLQVVAPVPRADVTAYFGPTGHNVQGEFLHYFNENGGLDMFGFPRTEQFTQDGYTVQWFQRAILELHPEASYPALRVQQRPLGTLMTAGRIFAPVARFTDTTDRHYVAATGHSISFGFLTYFQNHGDFRAFGNPISEEIIEPGADGKLHTVQYFQYARFEYHPELVGTAWETELGLLGDAALGLTK